jgi:EAL domain-containing protein (putative c-di-GMP-specific phosphodiesterase class I)
MIELAHNLGLEVTAEGVETQKIWDILKSRGCDLAQGYFMAEPMPADELLRWVKESKWGLG